MIPRFLLAGVGPLPPENQDRIFAPGLRIWGITRELSRAGHPVRLICTRFGDDGPMAFRYDLTPGADLPGGLARPIPAGGLPALIAAEAKEFGADAAAGSTDVMNHALAASGIDIPIWMDYLGDPMAERQLLALRHGSDAGLADQWTLLAPALARADRLSGCSTDQCAAMLGELAAVGRLNQFTVQEPMVHRLAPWIEPIKPRPAAEPFVRGGRVPADAFLVVQTGGFNTWLDPESIFAAVEKMLAANPRIHFATAGGAIPGHYAKGYEWFAAQAAASPHKARIHLLGWLAAADVPRLLAEADLGMNLDLPCPEGFLGTRSRLLDWTLAGLPVVSTPGCELALELGELGFLTLVPHSNPETAAQAVVGIASDPEPRRKSARRGGQWLAQERSAAVCLRPLVEWAAHPKQAPDLQAWKAGTAQPSELWRQASLGAENLAERRREAEKAAWNAEKLAKLEGSRWVRLALRLRGQSDLNPPPR